MALSKLSGDEQGIILGQLRNTLEPRLAMYFSSASKELRALLTPAVRQQLRTDYEAATALCLKMGLQSCKELREATKIEWEGKGLSAADLAPLAKLGSMLPALKYLTLDEPWSGSAGPDGVLRLAKGLVAGALPALTLLIISGMYVGDAGAAALAAAPGGQPAGTPRAQGAARQLARPWPDGGWWPCAGASRRRLRLAVGPGLVQAGVAPHAMRKPLSRPAHLAQRAWRRRAAAHGTTARRPARPGRSRRRAPPSGGCAPASRWPRR